MDTSFLNSVSINQHNLENLIKKKKITVLSSRIRMYAAAPHFVGEPPPPPFDLVCLKPLSNREWTAQKGSISLLRKAQFFDQIESSYLFSFMFLVYLLVMRGILDDAQGLLEVTYTREKFLKMYLLKLWKQMKILVHLITEIMAVLHLGI